MAMLDPPHPGRLVKDDIDALGSKISEAAKALGITRQQLYKIVNGDSAISPEMAVRLEAVVGSTADHWIGMQAAYDLAQARKRAPAITKGLKKLQPA